VILLHNLPTVWNKNHVSEFIMAGDEPDNKKSKVSSTDIQNMSSKQFLDQLVVPQLLPALNAVSTTRPSDPIQFLADYLVKHKKTPEEASES